jgi:hypothetical protein
VACQLMESRWKCIVTYVLDEGALVLEGVTLG